MVDKAEDTVYKRHYIPVERLTRLLNMKDDVGWNPIMDRAIHNGANLSIGTPERMHGRHIMISKTKDQKQTLDQGWISWIDQRHNWRQIVWSRTSSCSKMMSESERYLEGLIDDCVHSHTCWINRIKMTMPKDTNEYCQWKASIMQADKYCRAISY